MLATAESTDWAFGSLEFVFGPLNVMDGIVGADCSGPLGELVQPENQSAIVHPIYIR